MLKQAPTSYISSHRGVLYFRMRVPNDLQDPLKQKEYRRSLGTASRKEAKPKALRLALTLYEIFNTTRRIKHMQTTAGVATSTATPHHQPLTLEKVRELAHISLNRDLQDTHRSLLLCAPYTASQQEDMDYVLSDVLEDTFHSIDSMKTPPDIEAKADNLLAEYGISHPLKLDSYSEQSLYAYSLLCDRLLRAKAAVLESQIAGPCWNGSLRVSDSLPASFAAEFIAEQASKKPWPDMICTPDAPVTPAVIPSPESTAITLREAVEKRIDDAASGWKSKATPMDKRNMLETFMSIVGENLPMSAINRDVIRRYRAVMTSIPAQYKNKQEYRGLSFDELIALDVPPEKRFKRETLNNNFSTVKGFLRWSEDEGLIERYAPLKNILNKLPDDVRGGDKRGFTHEELCKLFAPEQFMTKNTGLDPKAPWRFLVPVMATFTGARIEEICQLELDDFKEEEGISYIHITSESSTEARGKSVKTKAGIRKVPLHAFLLGQNGSPVNILEYVAALKERGETRLFPMLRPNKRGVVSDLVGKWFTRYRRKCGVGAGADDHSNVTFHSFRHTVITTATKIKEVERRKVKQMVGHEAGMNDAADITTRYEGDYPLSTIAQDVIGALDFDTTLNLYTKLQGWNNGKK